MLSRRNIRVKVMQILYSMSRDSSIDLPNAVKQYREHISTSFDLYLFHLYAFIEVCRYAQKDAILRAAKHLPTEEDKLFTPRLFKNPLIQSLLANNALMREFQRLSLEEDTDNDTARLIYMEWLKSEEYIQYLSLSEVTEEQHQVQLLQLYRYLQNSPHFEDYLEDFFPLYEDDHSLVVGAMKKTIKALPSVEYFFREYQPTDETVNQFGEELLRKTVSNDKELEDLIAPTLKNWDMERVAVLDMILLKLALCEFLYFPTVPTKVTLNEFVEISKSYSTDKSKDFVNGVLDRLLKKLEHEGKILKTGRGLDS